MIRPFDLSRAEEDAIERAADCLKISDQRREDAISQLAWAAFLFKARQVDAPRMAEIEAAVAGLISALRSAHSHLATLYNAALTLEADPQRAPIVGLLHQELAPLALPDAPIGLVTIPFGPHHERFAERANAIESRSRELLGAGVTSARERKDAALVRLIGELGELWSHYTGRKPSPSGNRHVAMQSPFVRFVAAFWPAVGRVAPGETKVANALKAYHELPEQVGRIRVKYRGI